VGRKISRFRRIRSAMLVFAGESDVLVPASTARGILDLVNAKDKTFELAPGGHMGVILGSGAQAAVWARSADWLVSRSLAQSRAHAGRGTQARARAPLAGASGPVKAPGSMFAAAAGNGDANRTCHEHLVPDAGVTRPCATGERRETPNG
jgi:poly(3-hydroxyalkanoate) synthetase